MKYICRSISVWQSNWKCISDWRKQNDILTVHFSKWALKQSDFFLYILGHQGHLMWDLSSPLHLIICCRRFRLLYGSLTEAPPMWSWHMPQRLFCRDAWYTAISSSAFPCYRNNKSALQTKWLSGNQCCIFIKYVLDMQQPVPPFASDALPVIRRCHTPFCRIDILYPTEVLLV